MSNKKFHECIHPLHSLLSALTEEDYEWVLANRKQVLYATPGAEAETGILAGMLTEEQPWFQEIFRTKVKIQGKRKGWRSNNERLCLVVGVPFFNKTGEVEGALLCLTEYHHTIRANDLLQLAQEITREEDLFTALHKVTRRSLELFDVSLVGVWLWKDGRYRLASICSRDEALRSFVVSEAFPSDFGLNWLNLSAHPKKSTLQIPSRHPLETMEDPWVKPLQDFGLQTVVNMPLHHFGQTLGQIILFMGELEDPEDQNVYWLSQIVPFLSSFVYEQQLRIASIEREQALTFLLRGTEILVQADTEEQLLKEAGEMAMEILFLPGGFFFLHEEGEWYIRAPFGRLKQADWAWEEWVLLQIARDEFTHFSHAETTLHVHEVEENPNQWRKVLIQPIVTHSGVIGELWLMDDLEWMAEQRQEILSAYVRDVGVALETIRQRDELARLASTDRLTGILNRQGFDQRIQEEMSGTLRRASTFLLLILDLDFFKRLNDSQGHPIGDRALRSIAQNLRASVREEDIVARTGGDEFSVVLTGLQRGPEALQVIERLKNNLKLEDFGLDVSIGVAEFPTEGRDYEEMYHLADDRLYIGKNNGKGQIVLGQ